MQPGVICERCGAKILIPISGPPGMVLTLKNNSFPCHRCGHVTSSGDGVYVATATVFERITSAMPSGEELEALIRVLSSDRAQSGPEEAKAAAEEEAPSLAPYLNDYFLIEPTRWKETLAALLFALGWLLVCLDTPSPATGLKALEALFAAAKAAFGKHDDGLNPGNAAQRGKEAARRADTERNRARNAAKRRRRKQR
jgi:hypothetical protein